MKSLEDLKALRDEALKRMDVRNVKDGFRIQIGMGTCGIASGARNILKAFIEETSFQSLNNVTITQVGCMGECAYEPMAEIIDEDGQSFVYCNLTETIVKDIVQKHLMEKEPITRHLLSQRKG